VGRGTTQHEAVDDVDLQGVDAMLGPLQIIAMSLPAGSARPSAVVARVDEVESLGAVRVLDLLAVSKSEDGSVAELSLGEDQDFGALVSRLFPVSNGNATSAGSVQELWRRAQSLPAGTAVVFLLVEHRWARGIFTALEQEGGAVLGAGLLTPELNVLVDAEVAAMEEAARAIAAAHASEAEARLRAMRAWQEADQAVAGADRVRAAAAADVLRVLTGAGLLEAAAIDEALDVISAAGFVTVAAEKVAEEVVEADATLAAAAHRAAVETVAEDVAAVADAEARTADARRAASVTPAELRVLHYLPTKLPFALIADKLGISRQAAKSRAERAYKKLGVHSRAAAVQRAQELRVLP
jgi:DNA-binding CsgD family transcriptional regulator